MFILGYAFLGGHHSADTNPASSQSITSVTLNNGAFQELFISKDGTIDITTDIEKSWNYNTVLDAVFSESNYDADEKEFPAGNIDYLFQDITSVRIKRRESGSNSWVSLYEQPIITKDDLNIEFFDRFAKAKTKYDYALVPILNHSLEGIASQASITPDFEGLYVMGLDIWFSTSLECSITYDRNHPSSVVETIGNKYPFVIYNTQQNYDSGSAAGVFARFDTDKCDWDYANSFAYRKKLLDFLTDGTAKILKFDDGRGWLIGRSDVITNEEMDHPYAVLTTFHWVEIGDMDSTLDLYTTGLSNVNPAGW